VTPEAKTKALIKLILDKYANSIYYYMPVPQGYGAATLDYLGYCRGRGFAIEAKRPGGRPSQRQMVTIERIMLSGARVFVIDGTEHLDTVEDLDLWLGTVSRSRKEAA
jgi:hypothetical protein